LDKGLNHNYLKHLIHITCKKATYLVSKNEEHRLTLLEWLRLQFHLSICSFCRLFQKQTKLIGNNAADTQDFQPMKLSETAKERIRKILKN
jgi:hypothetical protein